MPDKAGVRPPERTVQGEIAPRYGEVLIRNRGRLPHWEKEEGLYFITFHLADSLPQHAVDGMVERQRILENAKRIGAHLTPVQKALVARYSAAKVEEYFDRGAGECIFRDPAIAHAMATALLFWHGKTYRLLAWCIMPNHVHVVCRMLPAQNLADVVKSWKVYSARAANRVRARSGAVWEREYYDRLIRGEGELDRAVSYVLNNPAKAGLANWKWIWAEGREALSTAGQETGGTAAGAASVPDAFMTRKA